MERLRCEQCRSRDRRQEAEEGRRLELGQSSMQQALLLFQPSRLRYSITRLSVRLSQTSSRCLAALRPGQILIDLVQSRHGEARPAPSCSASRPCHPRRRALHQQACSLSSPCRTLSQETAGADRRRPSCPSLRQLRHISTNRKGALNRKVVDGGDERD